MANETTLTSILINGARGRMGHALIEAARNAGITSVAAIDQGDDAASVIGAAGAVLDFSHHTATLPLARLCAGHGKPLIVGTTGHTAAEREAILEAVRTLPVVWAGNYSIGVTLLNHLVKIAAATLDASYQIELVEMHHRHKKDAPSGTAETLLQIAREARHLPPQVIRNGRAGLTGERPSDEIGVHALRGGDVVGDHTVYFAGEGERLELTHRAANRAIFAIGAIRAAQWVVSRAPGIYGMGDVLGISE
ncbi:MAG: 4-hydroxy-tetrahydrodipicolinate reductase [Puniceicoccales bacterium]|jgi:4-hydroxy-tetrahydrodipicolinate reductase|nr:4-hydroxy-tetrahydrodipicolinate reductase [Puniceicoccales bacterium]